MIANRRKLGTTSHKSSSRLPAASGHCIDRPVMLPPGCARLATRPAPTGSPDNARTIEMTDVAFFAWGAAGPVETNKLGRNLGVTLGVPLRPAIRDCDGAILDPAKVA